MDFNQARELLQRYRNGKCTPKEIQLIEQWYDQLVETGAAQVEQSEIEELKHTIEDRLLEQINESQIPTSNVFRFRPLRWAAAAAVIFALGTGTYFLLRQTKSTPIDTAPVLAVSNDVQAPSSNRATITLANGQQVYLDEASNGQLALQGNVKILKGANGEITYQTISVTSTTIPNNTLNNPRGSKVASITLADGTRVWLNSGSSLSYPVAFAGKERKVSVTGEAYFEVAKNQAMPFFVTKDDITIQVLGTHFNVNTYNDEAISKVTLLEGQVNVSQNNKNHLLQPGQQAQLSNSDSKVVNNADLTEVMAWKDGLFIFKGEDIHTIMRQLARWYNIEVQFEKEVQEKFYVKMDRNTNVSNVFKILETTGGVHFKIEGNKIMVKP